MPRLEAIQIGYHVIGIFAVTPGELSFDYASHKIGFTDQTDYVRCLPGYRCYNSEYDKRYYKGDIIHIKTFERYDREIADFVNPDINDVFRAEYEGYMIYPKMADIKRCPYYPNTAEDKNLWLCEDWNEDDYE